MQQTLYSICQIKSKRPKSASSCRKFSSSHPTQANNLFTHLTGKIQPTASNPSTPRAAHCRNSHLPSYLRLLASGELVALGLSDFARRARPINPLLHASATTNNISAVRVTRALRESIGPGNKRPSHDVRAGDAAHYANRASARNARGVTASSLLFFLLVAVCERR